MAPIDPKLSSILDRQPATTDSDDEDALISALEDDNDTTLSAFREQRLQQLHSELSRAKTMRNANYGTYTEIKDEKEVMDVTTSAKLCVVHFMKPDFANCRIMDQRLEALAPKHFDTRILSINVDNAPFLVAKLKIQVLPCVMAFIDGVSTDRIVGFEGVGYSTTNITTRDLEARLLQSGVLVRAKMEESNGQHSAKGRTQQKKDDEDTDEDWD
ncbi:hypothetical protein LTR66_005641 [Elasticomyces elasticus]|nr:hypothetical protein LTR66_005641 [Elasticomyces elasticus]KAK5010944.1 hypothetical protein LTR28_006777 [Elasticomyces elasticus]